MAVEKKIRIHIKNNRWREGSFPNTPEGEKVFAITKERFHEALVKFPNLKDRIESFIDWDENNFKTSMATSDILLTWNLPTANLVKIAPKLKWIHCISAGVEHLLPIDWLPNDVILTNNKGVHANKSGEYGLMSVLMLHNHLPTIVNNQQKKNMSSFMELLFQALLLLLLALVVLAGQLQGYLNLLVLKLLALTAGVVL